MTIFNSSNNKPLDNNLKRANESVLNPEDREKLRRYLDKWNWGAALLGWIWAFSHRKYGYVFLFSALSRLPGYWGGAAILIGMIVFGVYGNQWAWEERQWKSFDEFVATQKTWAKWGVIITFIALIVYIILLTYVEVMNLPVKL
jgi:hypothetical protein